MEWKVGDLINNRYEVFFIHTGGQGRVLITYDHEECYTLAMKTFPLSYYQNNKEIKESLLKECRTWADLGYHPNIVQATSLIYLDGSRPYLFMEYVQGGDLSRLIRSGALSHDEDRILDLALDFCEGMEHAIQNGLLLHGDIKPNNLLLSANGTLKITDFGLAMGVSSVEERRSLVGTLPYMAPECFGVGHGVDIRTDIYAFGATLYEMITGRPPHVWDNAQMYHQAHVKGVDSPTSGSGRLDPIIQRCLAHDPGMRYQSITELKSDLVAIYSGSRPPLPSDDTNEDYGHRRLVTKAGTLIETGDFTRAINICEHVIGISNNDKTLSLAWNHKGWAKGELDDNSGEAKECFRMALELDKRNAIAWVNYGRCQSMDGNLNEALFCYDRAISINPNYPQPYSNAGAVLMKAGRLHEAKGYFLRCLQVNPSYSRAHQNLIGLYYDHLNDPISALSHAQKCIEVDPWNLQALLFLYTEFAHLKDYTTCLNVHDRLRALHLRSLEDNPTFWSIGAHLHNMHKNSVLAEEYADKALKLNPSDCNALLEKAAAIRHLRNPTDNTQYTPKESIIEALQLYQRVVELDPTSREGHRLMGLALLDLGHIPEAIESLIRAVNLGHEDGHGFNDLGNAFARKGDLKSAVKAYENAVRADPNEAMFWYNLADCHIDLKEPRRAAGFFSRALKLRKEYPEAWHSLAICLRDLGEYEESLYCLDMAQFYDPMHRHADNTRASVFLVLGRKTEAITSLELAAEKYNFHGDSERAMICTITVELLKGGFNVDQT